MTGPLRRLGGWLIHQLGLSLDGPTRKADRHVIDSGFPDARMVDYVTAAVEHPRRYDDCIIPMEQVCPKHDHPERDWPAGRDCTMTCTECNSTWFQQHQYGCPHYVPWSLAGLR